MLTTVIGAYPKPNYLKITDWFNAKGGTSDGRFVAKMNTEIIELGPVNKSIHQIDEHLKISELFTLKEIYTKILIKVNQAS